MSYSDGMATMTAPMITENYPSPDYPIGKAWTAIWSELLKAKRRKDPYVEGRTLAESIAPDYGLKPVTMTGVLSRAAQRGILVRESRPVKTGSKTRNRTHYAVKSDA